MNGSSGRMPDEDLQSLRSAIGRIEVLEQTIEATAMRGLAATLERADVAGAMGEELPPLWHWLYFVPQVPQSDICEDGHAKRGSFLPAVPLPRRMWAGGRIEWRAPLRIGDRAQRTSTIVNAEHKAGRSGDLVFVTVRHELASAGVLALTEEQDIVYRSAPQPQEAPAAVQPAPADASRTRRLRADPVLLFRYSALTFNGHRIHYDRDYATGKEGYPGLVVHGPLIATLLAGLASQQFAAPRFRRFSFRAVRPVLDIHPFAVCATPSPDGNSALLWAQDHEGALAMRADVAFA